MIARLCVCGFAAALSVSSAADQSDGKCMPSSMMAKALMHYREVLIGSRPDGLARYTDLFASPTGGWTVVARNGGVSCVQEYGTDWAVPRSVVGPAA